MSKVSIVLTSLFFIGATGIFAYWISTVISSSNILGVSVLKLEVSMDNVTFSDALPDNLFNNADIIPGDVLSSGTIYLSNVGDPQEEEMLTINSNCTITEGNGPGGESLLSLVAVEIYNEGFLVNSGTHFPDSDLNANGILDMEDMCLSEVGVLGEFSIPMTTLTSDISIDLTPDILLSDYPSVANDSAEFSIEVSLR